MNLSSYITAEPEAGTYRAKFVGAETLETDYGPSVKLRFSITDGPSKGMEATKLCGKMLSPKSNLYAFCCGLKGDSLGPGERVSLPSYIGTEGLLAVSSSGGYLQAEAFTRKQG